jgi:hypothetical protein
MKTLPTTKDEWIGAVLFPFKVYVVSGAPFLKICYWLKDKVQPHFYGYPEEADFCVSAGYVLCLTVLLLGALVQGIFCQRRAAAITTLVVGAIGWCFLRALWPWGMAGR